MIKNKTQKIPLKLNMMHLFGFTITLEKYHTWIVNGANSVSSESRIRALTFAATVKGAIVNFPN